MRIMVNHYSHLIILTQLAIAMNSIKLWLPLCLLMTDNQYFKDKLQWLSLITWKSILNTLIEHTIR